MLSKAQGVFKNMHNAFYEWAWPKGVRWYRINSQIRTPRYPAPGSEPTERLYEDPNQIQHEYKVSYRDSVHNIRYKGPYSNADRQNFIHDALGQTVEEKLIQLGYISKEDGKVTLKMEAAKQLFLQKRGIPVDETKCVVDQIGVTENLIEKGNRDSIAQFVRQQYQSNKETNRQEIFDNNIDEIYNQEFYLFTSWGIADSDPIYQQVILDLETHIESFIKQEQSKGSIPFFEGDPSYWNVLDNSHAPENVLLTQTVVKDLVSNLDLKNLEKQQNSENYHKHKYINYPYNKNITHEN